MICPRWCGSASRKVTQSVSMDRVPYLFECNKTHLIVLLKSSREPNPHWMFATNISCQDSRQSLSAAPLPSLSPTVSPGKLLSKLHGTHRSHAPYILEIDKPSCLYLLKRKGEHYSQIFCNISPEWLSAGRNIRTHWTDWSQMCSAIQLP